jgi:hypothetical protein
MRSRVRFISPLVLFLLAVASARADGLGPHGLEIMAGIGLSIVIGGLALSAAVVLAGFFLVRGRPRWPVGVWWKILFLALFGVLVIVSGPFLTVLIVGR